VSGWGAIVAQATSAVGGEAGTVLAGVHERRVPLLAIRSLFLVSLIAFISWPLLQQRRPSSSEIGPTVRIGLLWGGHARVPENWTTHSAEGLFGHYALRLLALRTPKGVGVWDVDWKRLSRDDAFVSVSSDAVLMGPESPLPSPLPSRLTPSTASTEVMQEVFGEPVLHWSGLVAGGVGHGGPTRVTYWVGPKASPMTRARAKYVLDSLRIPGWDREG
jgi:hypothetical protein